MRPLQSWGCRERRARKRINKSLRSHISAVKKCCQKNKNLRSSNTRMRGSTMKNLLALFCFGVLLVQPAAAQTEIKVGLIGLDTSHVIQFAQLLNDPSRPDHVRGARIVAAFKGGSPDVESSATRIEKFTAEIRDKWKIEIVDSIEELTRKVDAVIITSVDGRTHLKQVRPVFAAKKRVFIDKPFAGTNKDARESVLT